MQNPEPSPTPQGVPLTQANLTASLHNIRDTYKLTGADVSYLVMPLFHVHGLMAGAWVHGCGCVHAAPMRMHADERM